MRPALPNPIYVGVIASNPSSGKYFSRNRSYSAQIVPERDPSKPELFAGLLLLGAAATYACAALAGLHAPTRSEGLLVLTWAAVGLLSVLKYGFGDFRRWWYHPRVQTGLGAAALAVGAGLHGLGDSESATVAVAVGALFVASAGYESHRRGTLRDNPFLPVLGGLVGLGFVGFAVFLRVRYPPEVVPMALTSAVVGFLLLAWSVRRAFGLTRPRANH